MAGAVKYNLDLRCSCQWFRLYAMEASPLFTTSNKLKADLESARERAAKTMATTPKRLLSDVALEAILLARPTTELSLRGVKESAFGRQRY